MRKLLKTIIAASLLWALTGHADVAVVVNPDSDVTQLTRNEAINIFMGRYRKLPNGDTAIPVDLAPEKARFYRQLVEKELSEINAYWARLMFSGQASPPQQMQSVEDVQNVILNNRGAIGYMDSDMVTEDMRVVLILPDKGNT